MDPWVPPGITQLLLPIVLPHERMLPEFLIEIAPGLDVVNVSR
jgi:hypothetical protein